MNLALKKLMKLQEDGKLVLTDQVMERINYYLHETNFLEAIGQAPINMIDPKGKNI